MRHTSLKPRRAAVAIPAAATAALCCALLTGCGGGSSTATPAAEPATVTATVTAPATGEDNGGDTSSDDSGNDNGGDTSSDDSGNDNISTDDSTAQDTFVMPKVVGQVLQTAQDRLQSLGSYVMDQQDAGGLDRLQLLDSNWKVCSQKPKAGATVSASDTVTLASVKLEETCP